MKGDGILIIISMNVSSMTTVYALVCMDNVDRRKNGQQARPLASFVDNTINLPRRNFPSPVFMTKFPKGKVIVRPLSTVEYTTVASLFHCRQWSNLIHDREQARREWESELRHVNSLQTLL